MSDVKCCVRRAALAAGLAAVLCAVPARAQDDFAGAKTLYVNASYEEALGVLDKQVATTGTTGAQVSELHHYRALCLLALGRTAEADQAIALSVAADPFSVPDTSELSPRVASVFTAARARLIPDVARTALADGRQLMQKGDAAGANRRFEAVIKLLAEPGLANRADLSDLTLAANAFVELTRTQMAAAAAAAAPPVTPAPATPPPAASAPVTLAPPTSATNTPAARTTGAQPPPAARPATGAAATTTSKPAATRPPAPPGFVAAVPISQTLPPWSPGAGAVAQLGFTGGVRVVIDATGKVISAVMEPSVYPPDDRQVLAATREWTYRPATQNGQPVASERVVEIVLRPRTN